MIASNRANGTSTFDLCGDFARLAALYEARYAVGIQLARIAGNRWEYVAGNTHASSVDFTAERIRLGHSYGLIVYGGGRLDGEGRAELAAAFVRLLGSGIDPHSGLTRSEILDYLRRDDTAELFRRADEVRKIYCGDEVYLRGIIEFSNYCKRGCLYCGLRDGNGKLPRYRMSRDEILESVRTAERLGYQTVVLQSGEDVGISLRELCETVRQIKKESDCAVTLSVGERSYEDYRALKESGADRYLLKFETSNRDLFHKLKPDSSYDERMRCLKDLRRLGYQVGSGCMVGLPGQTIEDLADDLMFIREFDFDMAGIGPFIPHPGTPLYPADRGTLTMVLKMVALARILTKNSHLPATTATGSIHPQGRQQALRCGANVLMPNLTPAKYRPLYEIYPNKICLTEQAEDCGACVGGMVLAMGRKIGRGYGHSLKLHEAFS